MATLYLYKCKKCGWSIKSWSKAKDYTMCGGFVRFICKDCKELFDREFEYEHENDIDTRCPKCGSENTTSWKPSDRCPKCGGKMERDGDFCLMVD